MIVDACSWDNPGAEKYEGTTRAAIMAMVQIPLPVRHALIEKADRKDRHAFADDHVLITRDRIEGGKFAYRDEVEFMAGGDKGKICKTVTRRKWDPNWQHRALVFCAADWCVAEPSVCRNWLVVHRMPERLPPLTQTTPPSAGGGVVAPLPPLDLVQIPESVSDGRTPVPRTLVGPPPLYFDNWTPGIVVLPPPITNTVPEPPTWLLLGSALVIAAALRRYRRK